MHTVMQVVLEQKKLANNVSFPLLAGKQQEHHENDGLKTIQGEFQKVNDAMVNDFLQARAFINDISIISKHAKIEHVSLIEKVLKKTDVSNASLKSQNANLQKSIVVSSGSKSQKWKTKQNFRYQIKQQKRQLNSIDHAKHSQPIQKCPEMNMQKKQV